MIEWQWSGVECPLVAIKGTPADPPKPTLTVEPQSSVFTGDSVTLRCDIDAEGVTSWRYIWYKEGSTSVFSELQEHTFSSVSESDAGKYFCYGLEKRGSRWSHRSDEVTLTVSAREWEDRERLPEAVVLEPSDRWDGDPDAVLLGRGGVAAVLEGAEESPPSASSVFTGDSVTLRCEVDPSRDGWEFLWSKNLNSESTEAETKTINPVKVSDGGEYRGETVTLRCDIDAEGVTSWRYNWYKEGSTRVTSELQEHKLWSVSESDAGKYSCEGSETEGSHWSHRRDEVTLTVSERPKPKVSIKPDQHVFRGETVTLRCDIDAEGVTSWRYNWYKEGSTRVSSELQEHTFNSVSESDAGKYSCEGSERGGSHWSHRSDEVTLTVSDFPKPTLTVEPQSSVFTGDSVTLRCEVDQSRDGWEFLWSKNSNSESTKAETKTINPVKVSDGGEYRGDTVTLRCDIDAEGVTSWRYNWYKGGSFRVISELQEHTFSSVSESDAGKYSCNGLEKGGSRRSQRSDEVTLTVSDPRAVLSVSPQKWLTEGDPVTLICEVNGSSTGWTFSWFTVSSDVRDHYKQLSDSSRGSGGKYTVSSAALNHTGVYVCRAEREKTAYNTKYSNTQLLWVTGVSPPVSLIISPSRSQHFTLVSLSLSCEDQSNSDGWTVRRYTDSGRLEDCSSSAFGSQTGSTCTISYTITSHTGVYWCQSESGEKSHPVNITVHSSRSDGLKQAVIIGVTAGLTVVFLIIVFLVLLWRYRNNKGGRSESPSAVGQQQNISQTLEQNQSEDGYKTLLSDSVSGPTEITYAEIEMKSTNKQKKEKENKVKNTESCDVLYSELKLETDQGAGSSDVTYAQVKKRCPE
ncbi:B-cell receptor CD22 [Anabarilius grahami]|uniref:B-cell receptor CD22 n=1 Tax=Anabarilius grahami TaxID=495550 RepID=A0A3N0YXU7_ANAGA|nr:B-cell receptor CD22 [Anabarilius grahami]